MKLNNQSVIKREKMSSICSNIYVPRQKNMIFRSRLVVDLTGMSEIVLNKAVALKLFAINLERNYFRTTNIIYNT